MNSILNLIIGVLFLSGPVLALASSSPASVDLKATPLSIVNQLVIELSDEINSSNDWIRYTTQNSGRLKALNVTWDDFRTALYNVAPTRALDLSKDSESARQFHDILNKASPTTTENIEFTINGKLEIMTNKLWAVHSTDYFPEDKISLTPVTPELNFFRPTLHFSLGGLVRPHHNWSWEKKIFAVLTPLADLQPQLLNIMPQDTFIAGSFKLTPSSIVLVPARLKGRYSLKTAELRYYDDNKISLRSTIDQILREKKAWLLKSHHSNTTAVPKAYVDGVNIHLYSVFSKFLKNNPKVHLGSHVDSITNAPSLSGILDNIETTLPRGFYPPEVVHSQALIASRFGPLYLQEIDETIKSPAARKEIQDRYRSMKPILDRVWSGQVETNTSSSSREYFEVSLMHFLKALNPQSAESIIAQLPPSVGLLDAQDRALVQKISRSIYLDFKKSPNEMIGYQDFRRDLERIKSSRKSDTLIEMLIVNSSKSHESSVQFLLSKDNTGHHVLNAWMEEFRKAGFFEQWRNPQYSQLKPIKNNLACHENNLIDVETGLRVGTSFSSMDYCLQAIEGSTDSYVCGIHGSQVMMLNHTGLPSLVGQLQFFSIPLCSRLLPYVK